MTIIDIIESQIRIHTMWFHYYLAMASTGIATSKAIFHGTNGPEFTDDEKILDAMETAERHIRLVEELTKSLEDKLEHLLVKEAFLHSQDTIKEK